MCAQVARRHGRPGAPHCVVHVFGPHRRGQDRAGQGARRLPLQHRWGMALLSITYAYSHPGIECARPLGMRSLIVPVDLICPCCADIHSGSWSICTLDRATRNTLLAVPLRSNVPSNFALYSCGRHCHRPGNMRCVREGYMICAAARSKHAGCHASTVT